jgi:hypothetical protein
MLTSCVSKDAEFYVYSKIYTYFSHKILPLEVIPKKLVHKFYPMQSPKKQVLGSNF